MVPDSSELWRSESHRKCSMERWKPVARWLGGAVLVVAVLMLAGWDSETEVDRLARLLDIRPSDTVADIGAGDGGLSIEVATVVGEAGQVFATERSPRRRDDIREAVAIAGLGNVTVVEAGEHETNLAPAGCDAIFMRRVYHHLTDAAAFNASLYASLKPGGRLAIIELEFSGILSPLRGWSQWTDDEPARLSDAEAVVHPRRIAGRCGGHRGRADPRHDGRLAGRRPLRGGVPEIEAHGRRHVTEGARDGGLDYMPAQRLDDGRAPQAGELRLRSGRRHAPRGRAGGRRAGVRGCGGADVPLPTMSCRIPSGQVTLPGGLDTDLR